MNPLLIAPILEIGKSLIERFFPDPQQRAAAELELLKMQQSGALQEMASDLQLRLAQLEVNKAEAGSGSLFVAGWRPAVGWVCVAGLAWQFIGYPIAAWSFSTWWPQVQPPVIVSEHLMELILAMLGLAGLRSFEKVRGATNDYVAHSAGCVRRSRVFIQSLGSHPAPWVRWAAAGIAPAKLPAGLLLALVRGLRPRRAAR